MEICKKIRAIRKALKLTQVEFALPLKVEGGYISSIETGTKEPSDTLLTLLLHHYRINEVWWETGEGEMFKTIPPPIGADSANPNWNYEKVPPISGNREQAEKETLMAVRRVFGFDAEEMIQACSKLPGSVRKKVLGDVLEILEKMDEEQKRREKGQ